MKKLFALLVVLALAVSLFAACNSNEDTTTTTDDSGVRV